MIRINDKITAPEVRLIDETGANVGVLPIAEALAKAKERGLDLIEIAPTAKPPVARIMSFDKFRYQENKKLRKQRLQQRGQEMKGVRITPRSALHDLQMKVDRVNEFLEDGNVVEIQLRLRGREKANKDWARKKLLDFIAMITPEHKVIFPPKYGMRGFNMQVAKK